MKSLSIRFIIRTADGKQQQFTLSGDIQNPDIDLAKVAWEIERTINDCSRFRAHADITESETK